MTTYLSLNGTSDYIKPPSTMVIDEIVFDTLIAGTSTVNQYLFNGTSNIFRINANGSSLFLSAVTQTGFVLGSRTTIDAKYTNGSHSQNLFLYSQSATAGFTKSNVYDIKCYLAGALVAHYDMSTGTVQDVSGNGNHATLTGGTWLDDGTGGGTGTTYSGAGTSAGTSSLTQSEKVIQSASGTSQGSSSLSSTETVISHTGTTYSESGTAQGSSSLSNNETVIYGANGSSQGTTILSPGEHLILPSVGTSTGQSSLTSNETVVGHGTTTYSASGQAQGSSSLSSAETMSYTAAGTAQGLSSLIAHEIISLLASGISDGYSTLTFIDKSNQIIGTIHLKGSQVLNVTLQGEQSLNVNLKGGI